MKSESGAPNSCVERIEIEAQRVAVTCEKAFLGEVIQLAAECSGVLCGEDYGVWVDADGYPKTKPAQALEFRFENEKDGGKFFCQVTALARCGGADTAGFNSPYWAGRRD